MAKWRERLITNGMADVLERGSSPQGFEHRETLGHQDYEHVYSTPLERHHAISLQPTINNITRPGHHRHHHHHRPGCEATLDLGAAMPGSARDSTPR